MKTNTLYQTEFPGLTLLSRGKVRDIYDLGDSLLMVATDRISAFDVIMDQPVPGKGKILTQMTLYWLNQVSDFVNTHLISADVGAFPEVCQPYKTALNGRSLWIKKATPVPFECVVRGYLAGSGWKEYCVNGRVCGIPLPEGLRESEKLESPVFTPATKAEKGTHDENVPFRAMVNALGEKTAVILKDLSLKIYNRARDIAEKKGIILADTKMEFGFLDGEIILIDELLTPDSSRFWPASDYEAGRPQKSYDKQFLRDYLEGLTWDKTPPPPVIPEDIIEKTRQKYEEAFQRLAG
jgi:phosphoribosylaminoimidazole-succinocarboxamide synthase